MIACWLAYVLLAAGILNSQLVRRVINPHPLDTKVEWRFAFSPWPRRLHVYGLEVRNQNPRRQWELRVDRAVGDVAVLPLLDRTFRTWDVRADGAELRYRPTLPPEPKKLEVAELFPGIETYSDPPLRPEGPLRPPRENAWTFEFHRARFEGVRALWGGGYRFETLGTVEGDLVTRAGWSVRFDARARLRLQRGRVGEAVVARDGWLHVDASMDLPDIPGTLNADRVRTLRAKVGGALKLTSFDALVRPVGDLPTQQLRGAGTLAFDGELANGALVAGSRILAGGEEMSGRLEQGWTVRAARWKARALVEPSGAGDGTTRGRLELSLERFGLAGHDDGLALETPRVTVKVVSEGAAIVEPFPRFSVSAFVAPTRPVPVAALIPEGTQLPFTLRGGTVSLRAGGTGDDAAEELSGDLFLTAEGLDAVLSDGAEVSGNARAHLNLNDVRFGKKLAQLGGSSLKLDGVRVKTRRGEARQWSMDVKLPRAWVALGGKQPAFRAEVQAHAPSTRPFVLLATREKKLPRWAQPLLVTEGLSAQALLELRGGTLRLRDVNVAAEGLSVRGGLVHDDAGTRGALLARVRGFPVGIELGNGHTNVDVVMPSGWLSERLEQQGVGGSGAGE